MNPKIWPWHLFIAVHFLSTEWIFFFFLYVTSAKGPRTQVRAYAHMERQSTQVEKKLARVERKPT